MGLRMRIDKSEKRFWNRRKFKKVEEILEKEFKDKLNIRGIHNQIWERKKQLLKEMYNIDWKSPAELNPSTIFD